MKPIHFATFLAVAFCSASCGVDPADIATAIHEELPIGSPQESIEAFLARHNFQCGYDRLELRYNCRLEHFNIIRLTVYVDKDGAFTGSDVEEIHLSP